MRWLKERTGVLIAIVALIAVAVYANSLLNGFALDDRYIIEGNPRVHSPRNFGDIWLTPYWPFVGAELGLYRPGVIFLYAIQWKLFGGAAWGFHSLNVLLHASAAVLSFVLLRRLTGAIPAFVGALIFAVHPVHTEAVANVVGQAELVAAVAVLAACVLHSGRPDGVGVSWPRRIGMLLLFGAALTTKESAVVLPALLVITDFAQRRVTLSLRGFAAYADAMLMPIVLFAATLALYLIVRYDVMGGAIIGTDAAPMLPFLRGDHRVLNALRAFPELVRLLVFPVHLAADYSPAAILPVETVRPLVVLGAILLAGLTVLSLATPWLPRAGFPAAWFLISIITVSNLFFPIGVLVAERTLYLPSFAVSAAVAFAWESWMPRADLVRRRLVIAAAGLAIVAGGMRTWARNPVWDSTETVWESMQRDQPMSYRTQWLTAVRLWRAERFAEAEQRFLLAIRLYDRDTQVFAEYGNFLIGRGRFEEAIPLLERAHRRHPYVVRSTIVVMHGYLAVGRYADAIDVAKWAYATGASPATTFPARAFAHQQRGELDDAIAAWRLAVTYAEGTAWRLQGYLARATAAGGYPEVALAALDSALAVTGDTTAVRTLARVREAVLEGCYAQAAQGVSAAAPLPPEAPLGSGCDDLGHWFAYILRRQNASDSHNARQAAPTEPPDQLPQPDQSVVR